MIKKTTLLTTILGILLFGCQPEVAPPLEYNGTANMTIAEFQKFHTLDADDTVTLIDTNAIITGIVISTDQFGSCYKEIFFQDETGGISIRTSNTSYYTKYPIGQRIFVKAKDLYLGNYASGPNYGFYQIGDYGNSNGGMEYLSANKENQHVFRSGLPVEPPEPKRITKRSDVDENKDFHTLVKLVNCYFVEADGTTQYYEERLVFGGASNQNIKFNLGSSTEVVVARISSYSTFKNDILPQGALTIEGILTKFGSTYQFIIQRIEDVQKMPEEKLLLSYDMTTNPFSSGWSNLKKTGTTEWVYNSGMSAVTIQAPNGEASECWLVSPKLNFSGEKDVALFINYRIPFGTSDNAEALYTIDGTTWHSLDFTPEIGPTSVEVIQLPANVATNPNLQIAFQYKTTDVFPMWIISEITFKANVAM